jgi:hypothetical protein
MTSGLRQKATLQEVSMAFSLTSKADIDQTPKRPNLSRKVASCIY